MEFGNLNSQNPLLIITMIMITAMKRIILLMLMESCSILPLCFATKLDIRPEIECLFWVL